MGFSACLVCFSLVWSCMVFSGFSVCLFLFVSVCFCLSHVLSFEVFFCLLCLSHVCLLSAFSSLSLSVSPLLRGRSPSQNKITQHLHLYEVRVDPSVMLTAHQHLDLPISSRSMLYLPTADPASWKRCVVVSVSRNKPVMIRFSGSSSIWKNIVNPTFAANKRRCASTRSTGDVVRRRCQEFGACVMQEKCCAQRHGKR